MTATDTQARKEAPQDVAKRAAEELLSAAGIAVVIWVDDQAMAAAPETAIGLVEVIWRVKPKAANGIVKIHLAADADVRTNQLREHIDGLNATEVPTLVNQLRAARDKLRADGALPAADADEQATDGHALFSSEIEHLVGSRLQVMLPQEWNTGSSGIMTAAFARAGSGTIPGLPNTLVLFDIDLSEVGLGRDGGVLMRSKLLREYDNEPVLCGLISGKIPSDEQRAEWGAPNPDQLIFISKASLSEAPIHFVSELKRILLAPFATKLAAIVADVARKAHAFAIGEVLKVNVGDLVHSSIVLPHKEGIHEMDTLRRIYDSYFREGWRSSAAENAALAPTVAQLRSIDALAPEAPRSPVVTTWKFQRREIYDNIQEVNRLHLPIEAGDVFRFGGLSVQPPEPQPAGREAPGDTGPDQIADKLYVVVAPLCDTIVRGSGLRKLKRATLARIREAAPPKGSSNFRLKQFNADASDAWIDFSDTISIPFDALDLCALRHDGAALLSTNDTEPSGLTEGWRLRRAKVIEAAERYVDSVRKAFTFLPDQASDLIIPGLPDTGSPLRITVSMSGTKRVAYNFGRFLRLGADYATAMLTEYAFHVARPAYAVDLTTDVSGAGPTEGAVASGMLSEAETDPLPVPGRGNGVDSGASPNP